MISLPLLHSLDVTEYGLYPGEDSAMPGLHVRFRPGLTLVLGANGLGKTTLVTMLYRLLTGPHDIPALAGGASLGTASLRVVPLRANLRRTFAQRVADGATRASARLVFDLGGEQVSVERNLHNLTLRSFSVGDSLPSQDEQQYQKEMARLTNVSTFGDWIMLLTYIVFYFEDRRSLVWDPSAQRQLLRILFLEPNQSQHWTEREREILEVDTRLRNVRAVVTREERELTEDESLFTNAVEIREQLRRLEQDQRNANESLDEISSNLLDIEARNERAQLRFLTLEQQRESQYRELEHTHLLAVNSRLPQHSDSARYILAQLLTEAECLICGNSVPSVMESMESRIHNNECVVCGSNLVMVSNQVPVNLTDERLRRNEAKLRDIDNELGSARNELEVSENERNLTVASIQKLQTEITERTARTGHLLKRLPPEESKLHDQQRELVALHARIEVLQHNLVEKRTSFAHIIAAANAAVEKQASEVQRVFGDYAREFLLEECRLLWSPKPDRLGQTGRRFDFPAFELELGGSNFTGTVRRGGPDEVSESQREFIDISFRMALAWVATRRHATSLVMDAPESSLDTVFVGRAARNLGLFGRPEAGNRLIVTSNLVDGKLIPSLLRHAADEGDRVERVVDLLTIAAPTAALLQLRQEYDMARDELLEQANASE